MIFTPRPYQSLISSYIHDHPRCAAWVPMGFGKTAATLSSISTINLVEPGPTLVLAPLRVAQSVWPTEIQKWDDFHHLSCSPIVGDTHARLAAFHTPADIYTLNYENLPWLLDLCISLKRWPFTKIVADEATRLKSFRNLGKPSKDPDHMKAPRKGGAAGLRARALGKVVFHSKVTRFIELTGTPSPNGLIDLWGQLWFLDRGQRLGRTRTAFLNRWFSKKDLYSPYIPHPHTQKEIENLIKDICISLKAEDWFDIDEPIITDVPVSLPEEAMILYKQFEKELFAEIQGSEIEASNAASKSIKCLQLANGAVYTDDQHNYKVVHDAKLDALESIIEETAGAPILVAYHFRSDLERISKRFPQAEVLGRSPHTIDRWNKGEIPILLVHPASAGHGLNLADGGNILIMFGHNWDLEQYQQVIERIGPVRQLQAGHPRSVFIYNIRAEHTIDNVVINRRISKRRVQDLLLEAAKGTL
jgi:SNF2 family DNA or RNA helicase